jgi:Tfp pilus assembly protein PilE
LVVIAIIGILIALLLPAVQAARESARRSQCMTQLREIGLAIQNHHDAKGHFPTGRNATGPMGVSWAYFILPHLEEQAIYDAYVETAPVYDPVNAAAMRTPIAVYACPSRRTAAADRDFDNDDAVPPPELRSVAVLGDYAANAGLEEDIGMEDNDFFKGKIDLTIAGPIFSNSQIKVRQITDGLSKTLAVGERHVPPPDVVLSDGDRDPALLHFYQGDNCFLAADSIMTILRGTEDGLADGPDDRSDDVFGGTHPGVTLFVFLDGHADALSSSNRQTAIGVNPLNAPDVDMDEDWLWLGAMSTIAGGETITE